MATLGDYGVSARMREVIRRLSRNTIEETRPAYRYATVQSVNTTARTATVTYSGEATSVTLPYGGLTPVVGATVRIDGVPGDRHIADVMTDTVGAHSHDQYAVLQRLLHRRNAYGSGGGALKFDGSVLSGTQRYIWIPSQGGQSAHIELSDTGNSGGPWSISGIGSWGILYATLTDSEWAMTTKLGLTPSRFAFVGYNSYVPSENHLVLGWRNSDGQDGRFFLGDGRVLDYWRTPTFQNGWGSYGGGHQVGGYRKDGDGFVHLRGLIQGGTLDTAAFTLPPGYRPAGHELFATLAGSNTAAGRVDVQSGGAVMMYTPSNAWVSLAGMTFLAEA